MEGAAGLEAAQDGFGRGDERDQVFFFFFPISLTISSKLFRCSSFRAALISLTMSSRRPLVSTRGGLDPAFLSLAASLAASYWAWCSFFWYSL